MIIKISDLDYGYKDLEPHIDSMTLEIHYSKHYQTYLDNLNKELVSQEINLDTLSAEFVLSNLGLFSEETKGFVKNQAGQVYNHELYWKSMSPKFNQSLPANLKLKIEEDFKDLDSFREQFLKAGLGQFGSGWVFLVQNEENSLEIVKTSNAEVAKGKHLLVIDVWEHAYYLKYQNRRQEYIDNFMSIINWEYAASQLK